MAASQETWKAIIEIPRQTARGTMGTFRYIGLAAITLEVIWALSQVAKIISDPSFRITGLQDIWNLLIFCIVSVAALFLTYLVFFSKGVRTYITDRGVASEKPAISFTPAVTIENGSQRIRGGASFQWKEVEAFYISAPFLVFVMKYDAPNFGRRPRYAPPYQVPKSIEGKKMLVAYRFESGLENVRTELGKFLPEMSLGLPT